MAWFLQRSKRNHTRVCAGGSPPSYVALGFLEAKMLPWPQAPSLGPSARSLSCEDICTPENSWFEEFGWSKHTKWEDTPVCCERLCDDLWLLGISSALALFARWSVWWSYSCWEKMAAFLSPPPPPLHCSLQRSPRLVSLHSGPCALP